MSKTLILTTPVANSDNQPGGYSAKSWIDNELKKLVTTSPGRQVAIIIEVIQS